MPTAAELLEIYKAHYRGSNIERGRTNQESGAFATAAYADYLIARLLNSQSRVLDFGAGTGLLVSALRGRGIFADGVEFSAEARQHCAQFRGFDLFPDITLLAQDAYDVVTMIEVIEHLTDPIDDLKAVLQRLRSGGVLFLTTPNLNSLRAKVEGGNWREARKNFHLTLFESASLRRMLLKAGFSSVDTVRFSPIQNSGLPNRIYARVCQMGGFHGTLAMTARR